MRVRAWTAASIGALIACAGGDQKAPNMATLQAELDSTRGRLDSTQHANAVRVADSIRREQTAPRRLALLTDSVLVSAPTGESPGYYVAAFLLPSAGRCKLAGRVEVVAGGNKDLVVALFRHDDFTNWRNSKAPYATGQAMFATQAQTISTLDIAVPDSGTYDLVLSNRFSTFTPKTALVRAEVVCVGSPVPAAVKDD